MKMKFEELVPDASTTFESVTLNSTDFPYPRSGHRIVAYEDCVYSIGGYNPDVWDEENSNETYFPLFKEVWRFNVLTKKWSKLKYDRNLPNELASHSAALHENYILTFGGSGVPFGRSSSNNLHALNLRSQTWRCLPCTGERPVAQYGHAMVVHENDVYIVGGTTGTEYNMDVFHLNLNDPHLVWENLSKTTRQFCEPRYRHEAIFFNNCLVIFGGGTSNSVCSLEKLDVFNLATNSWGYVSTKPDAKHGFPAPRRCHSLVHYANFVLITGGTNGSTVFDDVWRFDVLTRCWTRFGVGLPRATFFHSTSLSKTGGSVYLFGGVLNADSSKRCCRLYRLKLSPPSLHHLASEAVPPPSSIG